jgi:hypothetical protein
MRDDCYNSNKKTLDGVKDFALCMLNSQKELSLF